MDGRLFGFGDVVVEKSGRRVLDRLTGFIPDHQITVIAGPSGSGKSTMLRLCNRLDAPSEGAVSFMGVPLDELDVLEHRRHVGMVFQRPTPLPGTVADNLRTGRSAATHDEIEVGLARVGLAGFGARQADALSGGEAQRMCLARTLLTEPRFVLFDEPTSALDAASTTVIEELALQLADDGIPSAWVTHDMAQLRRLAHHAVIVIDGQIAQQGDVHEVLGQPEPAVDRFLTGLAT